MTTYEPRTRQPAVSKKAPAQPARLDLRDPLVLDTRELGRRPGSMRVVQRSAAAPAGMGIEGIIGVPVGADLALDLRLESVMDGVLVSGVVRGPLEGECGRCLDPVSDELAVELQELFVYPEASTDHDEQDGVSHLEGDLIDLAPAVRDAIVLALPLTPLCDPDCAGLCVTCGERLDDLPVDHTHDTTDARWGALAGLLGNSTGTTDHTDRTEQQEN